MKKAEPVQGIVPHSLQPYVGVQHERQLSFEVGGKARKFRVFTYQAYNAMGLVGPECNGIAICDDDKRQVLCDEIEKQASGYFGASQAQVDEFERICGLGWDAFRDYVNAQPRLRMRLEDGPRKPIKVKVPPMSDARFMTARQKAGVVRDWVRFVAGGFRLEDFTRGLYDHLIQNCSFIAHYNLHGFHAHYFESPDMTLRFLEQFDRARGCLSVEYGMAYWLNDEDYRDVNAAMVDLAAPLLGAARRALSDARLDEARKEAAAAAARLARLEGRAA